MVYVSISYIAGQFTIDGHNLADKLLRRLFEHEAGEFHALNRWKRLHAKSPMNVFLIC